MKERKMKNSGKETGSCADEQCPLHGELKVRGRHFKGTVIKIFQKRAVIEFERTVKIQKYDRFMKKKTKLHARIPSCMKLEVGDYVEVGECRPLSKIIHFVALRKITGENKEAIK